MGACCFSKKAKRLAADLTETAPPESLERPAVHAPTEASAPAHAAVFTAQGLSKTYQRGEVRVRVEECATLVPVSALAPGAGHAGGGLPGQQVAGWGAD